jgi:hypothetical protein
MTWIGRTSPFFYLRNIGNYESTGRKNPVCFTSFSSGPRTETKHLRKTLLENQSTECWIVFGFTTSGSGSAIRLGVSTTRKILSCGERRQQVPAKRCHPPPRSHDVLGSNHNTALLYGEHRAYWESWLKRQTFIGMCLVRIQTETSTILTKVLRGFP